MSANCGSLLRVFAIVLKCHPIQGGREVTKFVQLLKWRLPICKVYSSAFCTWKNIQSIKSYDIKISESQFSLKVHFNFVTYRRTYTAIIWCRYFRTKWQHFCSASLTPKLKVGSTYFYKALRSGKFLKYFHKNSCVFSTIKWHKNIYNSHSFLKEKVFD